MSDFFGLTLLPYKTSIRFAVFHSRFASSRVKTGHKMSPQPRPLPPKGSTLLHEKTSICGVGFSTQARAPSVVVRCKSGQLERRSGPAGAPQWPSWSAAAARLERCSGAAGAPRRPSWSPTAAQLERRSGPAGASRQPSWGAAVAQLGPHSGPAGAAQLPSWGTVLALMEPHSGPTGAPQRPSWSPAAARLG